MIRNKSYENIKAQQGQILIIVVAVMIIALGIGVSVSARFVNRLHNTSQTDNASRASAIAEAAVERFLVKSQQTLEDYINYNNCGSNCNLTIINPDGVVANATVTLSFEGNSIASLPLSLIKNETQQVNLTGYSNSQNLYVCWNSSSGNHPSIVASLIYGSSGSYNMDTYAYNSVGSQNTSNGFSLSSSNLGYTDCFVLQSKTTPVLLRIKSIYDDASVYVVPGSNLTLPKQGIYIESIGTVGSTIKKVKVLKSFSYLPSQFDYVLYQKSQTSPLSN